MSLNANLHMPAAHASLASEDDLDGLPLLGLLPSLWPGGEELFSFYSEGHQLTVASSVTIGESDGRAALVIEVSVAEKPAYLRIGLLAADHGEVITRMHQRQKLALTTLSTFERLTETHLSPDLRRSILVVDVRLPDGFDEWMISSIG